MNRIYFAVIILLLSCTAMAVTTSHWTHTSEADFKAGTFHNVVATNLGDLKLSRAVKTLLEQDPKISAVYSLCEGPDKTVYAGTGPQGVLLAIKDDQVSTLAAIDGATSLNALLFDDKGGLLIGTSGEKGKILRIEKRGEAPKTIFEADGVQYVWAMVQTPDGNVYAATGPNGQLFEIKPDGSHSVIFDSDENNLMSMIAGGNDMLYVGTDPNGLVFRVDRKSKESFVMYDAPESDITCLALDAKGNLYAGTAQPSEEAEADAAQEQVGRPEAGGTAVPIRSEPPAEPKPPAPPNPNPGRPDPIPKEPAAAVEHDAAKAETNDASPAKTESHEKTELSAAQHQPHAVDEEAGEASETLASMPGRPAGGAAVQPSSDGNAVYRITPGGFVTEVFRQPVLVMSMLERDGVLLVGTGSDGNIYQVSPAAEETIVLAKVDPKQVLSMLRASDGRVILGLANVGGVAAMTPSYAAEGTYISPVLDAQQISRFGKLQLHGSLPAGTQLKVATRSGNVRDASEANWSKWSDDQNATEFVPIAAPQARFLQYRLTFIASAENKDTPVVEDVDAAYLQPNLAPQVKSIKIAPSVKSNAPIPSEDGETSAVRSNRVQTIAWDAGDPNSDPLEYSLYFRDGPAGQWILMKDKLREATYEWDTHGVADGRYDVKVVASDEKANPVGTGLTASRVSDPLLVDNTPPVIGDLKVVVKAGGVRLDFKVVDRIGIVASADYAVDSGRDWQALSASDSIFDSPEETVGFDVSGLSPGAHQVTLRATDGKGNQAFENVAITVPDKK